MEGKKMEEHIHSSGPESGRPQPLSEFRYLEIYVLSVRFKRRISAVLKF
jgi:hypothetical protein